MSKRTRSPARLDDGFTLMEVLVAVVIFSVGLLGVVSIQYNSLRGNQAAFHRSIAASLAADGADRVRANLPGAASGQYDEILAAGTDPGCIATGCSDAELAAYDAFEWISTIEQQLPSGQGVICRDSTPYDGTGSADGVNGCDGDAASGMFAVKIWWDHDRGATDDEGNPTPLMAYRVSLIP